MIHRRAVAGLATAVLTGVALTGCGDDGNGVADMKADEILAKAKGAAVDAESLQVSGEMAGDGETYEVDMAYNADGATGTMTTKGVTLELVSVDDAYFMKGDKSFWAEATGDAAAAELLGGKYVKIPPDDDDLAEVVALLDRAKMIDEMLKPDGEISKGKEAEIEGAATIALVDDDGGTLYIATSGDPYPLQIEGTDDEPGTVDFVWNESVEVTAPSDDEIIDLAALSS